MSDAAAPPEVHPVADSTRWVVYDFPKNQREHVRVSLTEYGGHELVEVRVFYRDDAGVLQPSKKGVAINRSLLPELEAGIRAAAAAVRSLEVAGNERSR